MTTYYEKDSFQAAFLLSIFYWYNKVSGTRAEKTNFILNKFNSLSFSLGLVDESKSKKKFKAKFKRNFKLNLKRTIASIEDNDLLTIKDSFLKLIESTPNTEDSIEQTISKIEDTLSYVFDYGNIVTSLCNMCYCKLSPKDSKKHTKIFVIDEEDTDKLIFNSSAFITCVNFDLIVDFETWHTA